MRRSLALPPDCKFKGTTFFANSLSLDGFIKTFYCFRVLENATGMFPNQEKYPVLGS